MKICLSPQLSEVTLSLSRSGDALTINGETFDFTDLPDGATVKAGNVPCEWIVGDVTREGGELRLTLLLPHGPNPEQCQAFPDPLTVTSDGIVDLPHETRTEVEERAVDGGTERVTTVYRWRQEPEISTAFIPSPKPEPETDESEPDVEA